MLNQQSDCRPRLYNCSQLLISLTLITIKAREECYSAIANNLFGL